MRTSALIIVNMFLPISFPTQALQHGTTAKPVTAVMLKADHCPMLLIPRILKSETDCWHSMALVTFSAQAEGSKLIVLIYRGCQENDLKGVLHLAEDVILSLL